MMYVDPVSYGGEAFLLKMAVISTVGHGLELGARCAHCSGSIKS